MTDKFNNVRLSNEEIQRISRFGLGTFAYIFNRDFSKLLMVRRNEEKRQKYGFEWGLVGGKMEPGESIIEGAIREIKEEVGVEFDGKELKFLFFREMLIPERAFTGIQFYFAASIDESTPIVIDDESDGYGWFSVNALPESIKESKENIAEAMILAKAQK
jgi:ADP-ribose pyrophosphatase YjhB (NUDIX family)